MALDDHGVERWVGNSVPDMSGGRGDRRLPRARRGAGRVDRERMTSGSPWGRTSCSAGPASSSPWPCGRGLPGLRLPLRLGIAGVRRDPGIRAMPLELPFVFGAVDLPVVQAFSGSRPCRREAPRKMQRAWLAFAAHRRSRPREGSASGSQWDPAVRATMIFGAGHPAENAPRNEELAVLERHRPLVSGVPG